MKRVALILSIIFLSSFNNSPSLIKGNSVQEYLEEINEARKDPYAYGKKYGIGKLYGVKIDKKEFPPVGEVQLDSALTKRAEERALHVATTGKLLHNQNVHIKGRWVTESLAASTNFEVTNQASILIVDEGVESLGHRHHILDYPGKLIGIGIAKGKYGVYSCVLTY